MAIYAVQGLYAAGCIYLTYDLCRGGLNLPFLSNAKEALTKGEIKEFVDSQAKRMGLEKEVVVVQGDKNSSIRGNKWLPGKIRMEVVKYAESDFIDINRFTFTHEIAHIKNNDWLIIPGVSLAASLFTTFVLTVNRDLFTRYLGGLGVGLITAVFLRRRAERRADQEAMRHCSKEVNQDVLNAILNRKKHGYGRRGLSNWIFGLLFCPSLDEKIGYFQAHLKSQKKEGL
jgi:hypothetical protein